MYDMQCPPRSHRHPRNTGSYVHHHRSGASTTTTGAGAGASKKIRVVSSSSESPCSRSFSSTPTASYAFSPYSVVSPLAGGRDVPASPVNNVPTPKPPAKVPGVENEEDTMQTLVEKFSTLETEITCLLRGKDSLKDRIQSLESKQELMKSVIQNLEDNQLGSLKSRLEIMEQQARNRDEYLERLKKDRLQSLEQAKCSESVDSVYPMAPEQSAGYFLPENESRKQVRYEQASQDVDKVKVEPGTLKQMMTCWKENNCDLHLKRLIHSSRQIAAYEILEFAHKRLSTHLINHISETARGLVGDEKTNYIAQFIKHGPFECKPVGQGTYGELLKFVQREQKPKRELLKALKAAEDSLIAEAVSTGYRAYDVGDIRSQMTGFFTTAAQNYSRCCYPLPLAATEVTTDIVEDTQKAAEDGKLGALQRASKLIKLGCHFLRWQLAAAETV